MLSISAKSTDASRVSEKETLRRLLIKPEHTYEEPEWTWVKCTSFIQAHIPPTAILPASTPNSSACKRNAFVAFTQSSKGTGNLNSGARRYLEKHQSQKQATQMMENSGGKGILKFYAKTV